VTTKTGFPEIPRDPAEEVVSALILKNSSGSGILKPGFNDIGAQISPEVLEEVRVAQTLVSEGVSTEKQIPQTRKKRKGGCGKLTLT
jgi:hypothetical protein